MTPLLFASPGMAPPPAMPPLPTPEQLEEDKLIAEACSWEEISGVLHSDDRRNYSVDVETDATAFEDEEAEKQQRIEYVRAMTEMLQAWVPAIQANPSLAPFAKELAMFSAAAFKVGRTLEESLGDAFDQIKNMPPQPNPEAEKLQAEMAMAKERHAMEMEKGKADVQGKQQIAQLTAQAKQGDIAAKQQAAQVDMAKQQADMQMAQQMAHLELQIKYAELQLEREKMAMERERLQIERQTVAIDASAHAQKTAIDVEAHQETSDIKRDDMAFASKMKRESAQQGDAA